MSYNWNGDPASINWFSGVSLADSDWTYVALVVQPSQAALYAAFATDLMEVVLDTFFAEPASTPAEARQPARRGLRGEVSTKLRIAATRDKFVVPAGI